MNINTRHQAGRSIIGIHGDFLTEPDQEKFRKRVRDMVEKGAIPGGTQRNLESLREAVRFEPGVSQPDRTLLVDAQTSGGLLIALAPEREGRLLEALAREGTPVAATIGRVTAAAAGTLVVR